jgi:hypothetical protein
MEPRRQVACVGSARGSPKRAVTLAIALLAIALAASPASAAKQVTGYFGTASGSGTLGGQFSGPQGIAVNGSGAGPADQGDIYVVDTGHNRVQRFDSSGIFLSAWGADVIQPGKPGEVPGPNPFEICTVAADCKAGVASAGNGASSGNGALSAPLAVAVDGDTGNVYVSDRDNRRVNEYDGEGEFIASFGFDVDATAAASGYEICPATNVCKGAVAGSAAGQIGNSSAAGGLGVAVSPPDGSAATGKLYLADTQNRRVNTYDLDGASPTSFGSSSNFAANQPREIAVDSRGIVYASDSDEAEEIDRYDSLDANGGGSVFLPSIAAPLNESQTISFTGFSQPSSRYTLTCPNGDTTNSILWDFNPSGEAGRTSLAQELRSKCGGEYSVVGDGHPSMTVTFKGVYATTNVPTMTCTPVIGPGTCSIAGEVNGHGGPLLAGGGFGGATSGLAVDVDSDGGGPEEDALYVLRNPASGNAVVQQFGPVNDPGLAMAPTAADDSHGAAAGFAFVQGLGLDEASTRLFVSDDGPKHGVFVLGPPIPPPILTIDPITIKADTTASFSGAVDPKGGIGISCMFEYSTDQSHWVDLVEPDCSALSPSGGAQPISEAVAGLVPNTDYFVRLSATRLLDPTSTVTTPGVEPFHTDAVPPLVSDVGAIQVADISARMVGTIDPRNSDTGYVFEYGTTPALGSSTAPVGIGGGIEPITVSEVVGELGPDTTYYFKLVATNAFGSTSSNQNTFHTRSGPFPPANPGNCANEAIRLEQGSTYLPDCRAYEQVTPLGKNYTDVDVPFGAHNAGVSLDGNGVAFCTIGLFGEPPGRTARACAPYLSRRGAGGWKTSNPFPEFCRVDPDSGDEEGATFILPSADFSRLLDLKAESPGCPVPPLDPTAPLLPGPVYNLYRQDLTTDPLSYQLLNPENGGLEADGPLQQFPVGGSEDFSHVIYVSFDNQTAPPDSPANVPGGFRKLYEWAEQGEGACVQPGGCLTLLTKDPAGEPFTTPSNVPVFGIEDGRALNNAISSDAQRIFFQNPVEAHRSLNFPTCLRPGCQLYVREAGSNTYDVSASECSVSCGSPQATSPDQFISATPSGGHAFFLSCAKLTDDSSAELDCPSGALDGADGREGSKLYRWHRGAPPGHRLLDLTVDHESADGTQPGFLGLIGHSDDGDTAYFATRGQIVSGEPTFPFQQGTGAMPTSGAKLYRWRWNGGSPTVDYLGPHAVLGGFPYAGADINWLQKRRSVTPDGKYLLIYSKLRIDPAADSDSDADAYRWDEANGWICVSCQLPGVPSAGSVDLYTVYVEGLLSILVPLLQSAEPKLYMSDDGRVFFGTPDALVPADVNGEAGCPVSSSYSVGDVKAYDCEDLYEWNDGTLSLISSGTASEPSRLIGTTPSGADVFFYTRERLVGWDTDLNTDIYDSRRGGGFPEPPPAPAPCEGEACHGPPTNPPDVAFPGSAVFQSPADPHAKSKRRCPKGKRKVLRNGKSRCVKRKRRVTERRRGYPRG